MSNREKMGRRWDVEDLQQLRALLEKYPPSTPNRLKIIGEIMGRTREGIQYGKEKLRNLKDPRGPRPPKKKGSLGDAVLTRVESFDPETFPIYVQTMARDTYERERGQGHPITLRESADLEEWRTWVFTDGSGTRWHAAILIRPGVDIHRISTQCPEGNNNAAELAGINLGLAHSPPGVPVTIVSDQLWSAYYILGRRVVHRPYLIEAVRQARALLVERSLRDVVFIHIRGHQGRKNALTRWNGEADRLCRAQKEIDNIEPWAKL